MERPLVDLSPEAAETARFCAAITGAGGRPVGMIEGVFPVYVVEELPPESADETP